MIADPATVRQFPTDPTAQQLLDSVDRFEDGDAVRLPAAEIVDRTLARGADERVEGGDHIPAVDLVTDLLALVAEDRIVPPLSCRLEDVGEVTVQLGAGMAGPGEAAAPEADGVHAEV